MSEEKKLFVAAVRYERMDGLCRKFIVMAATKGEASDLVRIRCSSLHSPLGRELGAFVKCEEVSGIIEVSTERHIAQLAHSDLAPARSRLPRVTNGKVDRGQSFVEMALALPILLTLILGGIQIALAIIQVEQLGHAARQASVLVAQGGSDITDLLTATGPAGATVSSITPCAGTGTMATVQLQVTPVTFIPLPSFPAALMASGVSVCT